MLDKSELNEIIKAKRAYHKRMGKIPFEEKIKILIELQKIDLEMRKAPGWAIKPHEFVWVIE